VRHRVWIGVTASRQGGTAHDHPLSAKSCSWTCGGARSPPASGGRGGTDVSAVLGVSGGSHSWRGGGSPPVGGPVAVPRGALPAAAAGMRRASESGSAPLSGVGTRVPLLPVELPWSWVCFLIRSAAGGPVPLVSVEGGAAASDPV
jgi:hypothetical protein